MTQVIGITGLKRHGKGEVGEAIKRLVPGAVAVGFADKLKISMMRALGFDRPEAELIALADSLKVASTVSVLYEEPGQEPDPYDDTGVLHQLSGRQLLQWFGTEGGRKTFGESFWIDQTLPDTLDLYEAQCRLKAAYGLAPIIAITDVRFDNEAQRVKNIGGVVWEVIRPDLVDSSADTHVSEAGVSDVFIDRTIINDAGLDTLQWRVEQALELEGVL
jgi:hypothetical protein